MKDKKETNKKVSESEFVSSMKGVLKSPQKFYYLLIISGMSASKAQNLMFDLKYPKLRMNSPSARKKVIKILTALIDTITGDTMLYSRFRSLSRQGIFEQDGGMSTASLPGVGLGVPDVQSDPPFGAIPGLFNFVKKHKNNKNKFNSIIFKNMFTRK